jgi:cytochrome b involved in lipid metabolism
MKTRKLVLFFNFVIDYTDFDHPGYNDTLDEHLNKDIQSIYHSKNHSFNADLVLCHHIIGKNPLALLEDIAKGKTYYNKILNS